MAVLTAAGLATSSPAIAASMYAITDLGTLSPEGTDTRAAAINDLGQVVGRSRIDSTASAGFIWQDGILTQLPSTGLKNGSTLVTLPGRGGLARSINDSGMIVGAGDETSGPTDRALLWTQNTSGGYDLAIYDFGGVESYFIDINNQDQIAGQHIYAPGKRNAIYWENNVKTDLPSLGGDQNYALAINDKGQLVGYVDTDGADNGTNTYAASLWQKDASGNFSLLNLGTFGANQSFARDINDAGWVIGQLTNGSGSTLTSSAFLWQNGTTTDLGSLGGSRSDALSINNLGQVVGQSNTVNAVSHAFVWDNGQIFDLNSLLVEGTGWQLTSASSVNDNGQIVGYGSYVDNNGQQQTRAYLLQPVPESETTLGVLAFGAFGAISLLRRKHRQLAKSARG